MPKENVKFRAVLKLHDIMKLETFKKSERKIEFLNYSPFKNSETNVFILFKAFSPTDVSMQITECAPLRSCSVLRAELDQ